jgi:hypothetical protein
MGEKMRAAFTCAAVLGLLLIMPACTHLDGKVDAVSLYDAIQRDDVDYVRSAVRSGALQVNQSISVPGYQEGAPLIAVAARSASLKVLRYLIPAGVDVNARTSIGETPLMLASFFAVEERERGGNARERHDEAVRMLVSAGAELGNHPHHYTPLCYAAYRGHDAAVNYLLARGAPVDGAAENGVTYVNTPLMMAAIEGHMSTAVQLLRAGADASIRVHGGHTAAELAAKYRHMELARLLRCAERHGKRGFAPHQCHGAAADERPSRAATQN